MRALRAWVRVCACVRACVCVCVFVRMRVRVRACSEYMGSCVCVCVSARVSVFLHNSWLSSAPRGQVDCWRATEDDCRRCEHP